jgi:hypothetical protein
MRDKNKNELERMSQLIKEIEKASVEKFKNAETEKNEALRKIEIEKEFKTILIARKVVQYRNGLAW